MADVLHRCADASTGLRVVTGIREHDAPILQRFIAKHIYRSRLQVDGQV